MGAVRLLSSSEDSPVADDASRQRELEALRRTVESLRDPAGAVRLAVQMLAGPLRAAMESAPAEDVARVTAVLEALETSSAQLTELLSPGAPPAAAFTPRVVPDGGVVPDVAALVARAADTATARSPQGATVEVFVEDGVRPRVSERDLSAALAGLLENAMEAVVRRRPDAAPWSVELRVYLDPVEDLGDAMHVVFDVRDRGDGLPGEVLTWLADETGLAPMHSPCGPGLSLQLARRVAESAGGTLSASRVSGTTRLRVAVPHG
ncbi:MAG: ATP-binding protein [Myxococcota bacterium]